jgi:amino acid permease
VVINVLIITITLFTGFEVEVEVEDKQTVEYIYKGITGIPWGDLNWFALDSWSDFSEQLQGLASLIFCYVNHQLVFPLFFDLKNPSKRRIIKIFNRVHITEMIVYILVGMSGYLLLAEHSAVRPINAIVMASIQTIPMSFGKLLMVFSLFFAVPLNLFPARDIIYTSFEL